MCPRCHGLSNIYQSPLIYLFAVIAIVAAFLIYFFEVYAWNSLSLMTTFHVFIPFAIFFLISLFLIHLDKVLIKRIKKDKSGRFFDETGKEYRQYMGKLVPLTARQERKQEEREIDYKQIAKSKQQKEAKQEDFRANMNLDMFPKEETKVNLDEIKVDVDLDIFPEEKIEKTADKTEV
ncbi:MAG: hypothetical protein R3Y33_07405 [Clostridia bacterium]